jgi:intein-encoded DNA endonuclease-like protein
MYPHHLILPVWQRRSSKMGSLDLLELLGSEGIDRVANLVDEYNHDKYRSIWRRLTQFERVVQLRNAGMGYGTIARKVGVSKGEVVNWATGRYSPLRRHVRPIVGPQLAYGIGAWIGDGSLFRDRKRWKSHIRLIVKDADFAQAFSETLAVSLRRQNPLHISRRKDGRLYVSANNRILYDFLSASKARPELLKTIIEMHPGGFLAGFWDAEGSIGLQKGRPTIRAVNTRSAVLTLVTLALDRLSIHYTLTSRKREATVRFARTNKIYHRRHRVLYRVYVRSCCRLRFREYVHMKIRRKYERLEMLQTPGRVGTLCTVGQ